MNFRIVLIYVAGVIGLIPGNGVMQVQAQTTPKADFVPKTPEVQLLERYGNVPVEEYTGVPQISIPLHELTLKGNPFLMQLTYHPGGIRVSDEASWVGLGWNLSSFGSISVTAVGGADTYESASMRDWDSVFNYRPLIDGKPQAFTGIGRVNVTENCGGGDFDNEILKVPNSAIVIESEKGNSERDIYNVNFFGNHCKFFIKPVTGQIVMVGEKKAYRISREGNGWKVIDDRGYQYFFSEQEHYVYSGAHNQLNNTWHLTQVVYQGKMLLRVFYDSYSLQPLPVISDSYALMRFDPGGVSHQYPPFGNDRITRSVTTIDGLTAKYPRYLVTALDSVVFETQTRVDYRNAPSLSSLKVYSRATRALVKAIDFQKDYFEGSQVGADASNLDYVTKRLRLNGLLIRNGTDQQRYSFDYHGQLPYKTSFAQDFWGFFNGQPNTAGRPITNAGGTPFSTTRTLVPSAASLAFTESIPEALLPFQAANRGVNPQFAVAGTLKSMTYPTGGKTEFIYESNQVDNRVYADANQALVRQEYKQVINNGNSSFSTTNLSFTLDKEVKAKIKVTIKGTTFNITDFNAFAVVLVTNANTPSPVTKRYRILSNEQIQQYNNTKTVVIEEDVVLPPGMVVLAATVGSMPDQGYTFNNGTLGEITFYEYNLDANYTSFVGGLRIKEILNRDFSGNLISRKTYDYVTTSNQTSGKLVHPMQFYKSLSMSGAIAGGTSSGGITTAIRQYYNYYQIFSGNTYTYETSYSPANVGYSRVVVRDYNVQNNSPVLTHLEFYNAPLQNMTSHQKFVPQGITDHANNGKLRKKTLLDKNQDTVAVEEYNYTISNVSHFPCNINIFEKYKGPNGGMCGLVAIARDNRYNVVTSAYSNFSVQLATRKKTDYFNAARIPTQENYTYDPVNYQVSQIQRLLSNGKTETTHIKYANNLGSGDAALLTSGNMVGIPLERSTYVGTVLKDYYKVEYAPFNLPVLAPSVYLSKDKTGQTRTERSMGSYDSYGNPLEVKKQDRQVTTYLWGYNGQYPVARIENATHAEVVAALGGTSAANTVFSRLNAVNVTDAYINSTVQSLRASLAKAQVSTYTYQPLSGLSSMTDPRGITEYYKYDGLQRLKRILDFESNVLTDFNYHFRP
ncbi:hypothetical protein JHJ32_21110 [Parapedobacter sp. ISTM3]|uniref:hypothetical protein n=1 Tax=Parapedobacter sp. ISTM3 TaxID=2800130 RepID=UPI0019052294|nr:hypothetical protein [Parapedobacter sp. ISTM3]MBK1442512.1 hypothetical protein [Parapedobacter sp. ISTM3]